MEILSIDTKHGTFLRFDSILTAINLIVNAVFHPLLKGGKFAQALSSFLGFDLDDDINLLKFTRLVTFLSLQYLQVLEEGGFYFYRWDSRMSTNRRGGATDPWKGVTHGDDFGTDIIGHADMRGFQQILVLSQVSLDEVCGAYYDKYSWMQRYRMGKDFEMEYGALKVRLLSNNRALVFVHIKTGKLRTVRDGKPWDKCVKSFI